MKSETIKTDTLEEAVMYALAKADGDLWWKSTDFHERTVKEAFYRKVARHQIAAFAAIHQYLDEHDEDQNNVRLDA